MPPLSVWMVRLSLLALAGGALIGTLLLAQVQKALLLEGILRQMHLDLMLFGWLVQFVLGVAYWILPRHATEPERGPVAPAWGAFAVFQVGLVIAVAGRALPLAALAPAGRVLLAAGTLLFVMLLFPRVKKFRVD